MSRSRNIKPGFFTNDQLAECEPLARLLFAGLWCEADRSGRLEDRPKKIKALVLPYDDCDVDGLLNQLANHGFIKRYSVAGEAYIAVLEFAKHQNPHVREPASKIPNHDEHSASTVQAQCKQEESTCPAGLIPDSLLLIPDSLQEQESPKGDLSPEAEEPASDDDMPGAGKCPVQKIVALYHKHLPELAPVKEMPQQSVKMLRSRWRSEPKRQSLEWWEKFFVYVKGCPFLMGEKTDFSADLLWLVRPTNFAKVVNGNYERR